MGTTALLVSYFLQLSWHCFFSFTVTFNSLELLFFDVSYALPSVKFKHSYYVLVVDIFFRWGLSVCYAFHDQPEEDSCHFVYHCLNRDNAKRGLVIYRESFDTYAR